LNRIALITDSTSDLNQEQIERFNINVLNLRIIYKDREYIDRVEITPEEVYNNLSVEVPTTSLPSIEDIDKLLTKLENEGYTHAIVVTISSGLSGTFNSVKLMSENHKKMKIHVFDSLALSMAAGAIVLECGEMINSGKNFEEIIEKLPSIRDRIKLYFVLDTLQYLIKGGRIGKVSGTIGELLNIKPIISVNEEGVYYTYTKVRGRKQSIGKLIDIIAEKLSKRRGKIWVVHGGAMKEGKELFESMSKLNNINEISFGDISPVAGVHTGPGLLGVIVMEDE
jgi:DegV family protein with EDD domain